MGVVCQCKAASAPSNQSASHMRPSAKQLLPQYVHPNSPEASNEALSIEASGPARSSWYFFQTTLRLVAHIGLQTGDDTSATASKFEQAVNRERR